MEQEERAIKQSDYGEIASRHDSPTGLDPDDIQSPVGLTVSPYALSSVKRFTDVVMALVGLLILLILLPVIAPVVLLTSRGPLIFRQKRYGLNGSEFTLYKFRTMGHDAEQVGPQRTTESDPRITRVGGVLRRLYIDELPQLWNVLRGDMSVVGPRPESLGLAKSVTSIYPNFSNRLLVRPGITGLAQVRYGYALTMRDARCKLQYDAFYIERASLNMDLGLLWATIRRVIRFKGV
jgi:lipopolysaccharide/colanic/teichoic acid biosynthesis glycosyltransferase